MSERVLHCHGFNLISIISERTELMADLVSVKSVVQIDRREQGREHNVRSVAATSIFQRLRLRARIGTLDKDLRVNTERSSESRDSVSE